jgi:uncharacterized protein YecT (DUF1311 family)
MAGFGPAPDAPVNGKACEPKLHSLMIAVAIRMSRILRIANSSEGDFKMKTSSARISFAPRPRLRTRVCGAVFAMAVLMPNAFAQEVTCKEDGSHIQEDACLGERLKTLDAELNRVYKLALASMPEQDPQDSRRDQEQLRKSERAWLAYMHEDCALQGGMEGGSNAWVSTFAGLCEEKALKSRIEFLKSIAEGPHGG